MFIYNCAVLWSLLVGPTVTGSSVWFFRDIVSLFNYVIKPTSILITGLFSTDAKFRINIKILQKRANFAAQLEIPLSMENCGPYLWVKTNILKILVTVVVITVSNSVHCVDFSLAHKPIQYTFSDIYTLQSIVFWAAVGCLVITLCQIFRSCRWKKVDSTSVFE